MYIEEKYPLRDIVQTILKRHNKTEDDILYVRLVLKDSIKTNDQKYVNVDYNEFIERNGSVCIDTNWTHGKSLIEDCFGGIRIVLHNGEYLRAWEYDCSTGLEYIERMPIDNVEVKSYYSVALDTEY